MQSKNIKTTCEVKIKINPNLKKLNFVFVFVGWFVNFDWFDVDIVMII